MPSQTTWFYMKTEPRLWTTGFYMPDGTFEPDEDFPSAEKAAERVAWLNGGKGVDLTDTLVDLILASLATLLKRSYRPQDQIRMAGDEREFVDGLAVQIEAVIRSRKARRGD